MKNRGLTNHRRSGTPLVFAHRGASSQAPENTLAAFRLARELGTDGVELDIHLCATGELVVVHDESLLRTGGIDLPIRTSPLSALREHSVGGWFHDQFASERIPLLDEALDVLGPEQLIDIEIKPPGIRLGKALPGSVEEVLATWIERRGVSDRVVVSSFDPLVVRRFGRIAPSVSRGVIYVNAPELPRMLRKGFGRVISGADVLKPHFAQADHKTLARANRRGRLVFAWTVDKPDEAVALSVAGVDGLITNRPAEIKAAIA
ncbi:MAG: glycerophosphodiester phosphodiesterase [Spirochaetales bacterium]